MTDVQQRDQQQKGLLGLLLGLDEESMIQRIRETMDTTLGYIPSNDGAIQGALQGFERHVLRQALLAAEGNVSYASQLVGVDRKTVHRKIKRFGLEEEVEAIRRHDIDVHGEQMKPVHDVVKSVVASYLPVSQLPEALRERIFSYGVPALAEAVGQTCVNGLDLDEARDRFAKYLVERHLQSGSQKDAVAYGLGRSVRTLNRILKAA